MGSMCAIRVPCRRFFDTRRGVPKTSTMAWIRRVALGAAVGACASMALFAFACGTDNGDNPDPDFTPAGRRDASRDGTLGDPVDGGGGGDDAPRSCNGVCITRIAAGGAFACAIGDDNGVRCWGQNDLGQAGVASAANVLLPRKVSGLSSVKEIALGTQHACAMTDDGRVLCWGRNGDAVVTGAVDSAPHPTPVEVKLPKAAAHVASWSDHACAILAGGDLYCWGANDYGQCGVGGADGGAPPLTVPKPARAMTGVSLVGGSEEATCAVTSGASMSCFGRNISGQFAQGTSDFNPHPVPTPAQGVAGAIAQVARGSGYHIGVALQDGRAQLWGSNAHSAVIPTDGGTYEVTKPTLYPGLTGVAELATGGYFTCARKNDGAVVCWGDNDQGQSGSAPGGDKLAPSEVTAVRGATQVVAGRDGFACALVSGKVSCWGDDGAGQLGNGKIGGNQPDPTAIRFDE